MSPTEGLKAIVELIPIKLHLHKLASRSQLRSATLLENHLIKTLIDNPLSIYYKPLPYLINMLTDRQKIFIKGHLMDSNNKLYGVFSSFSPLNPEFNLGSRIIDIFPDRISFNLANKAKNKSSCSQQLDDMTIQSSLSPHTAIVVSDASIKNNIATSVLHIHICDQPLVKMVHHTAFVTSTEAELFTIKCGISQACSKENISKIIVIKIFWDYCKKVNSDNNIKLWKMTFQVSDGKGRQFLNLVDNNLETIELSYTKGGPWLQSFGHSNSLCARATRAITNHALIGEYHLRFFPNKDLKCSCGSYPIETRRYILYEYTRHNGYWNPRRDTLSHFVMFLNANPRAFAFIDNVSSVNPS